MASVMYFYVLFIWHCALGEKKQSALAPPICHCPTREQASLGA
jgi:hypothetical protein